MGRGGEKITKDGEDEGREISSFAGDARKRKIWGRMRYELKLKGGKER